MGFLEELRKQKAAETEASRQYEEKRRREAEELKTKFTASKKQFEDSGLRDLIDELFKINPQLRFDPRGKGSMIAVNYTYQLLISGRADLTSFGGKIFVHHGYSGYEHTLQIITTPEGEIRFNGDKDRGSSIVSKNAWNNNKSILEEALGKAYKNPKVTDYNDRGENHGSSGSPHEGEGYSG